MRAIREILDVHTGSIDGDRRARTLIAILLACVPVSALTALLVLPYENGPLSAVVLLLAAGIMSGLILAARRGHLGLSVAVFAVVLWLVVVVQPVLTGDMSTNPLAVPLGAVILIYVLPGHRLAWTSLWSLSALLVLLVATTEEQTVKIPPYLWLLNTALVTLLSVAVVLYGERQLRGAIRQQEHLEEELSARDRVLRRLEELAHTDPLTGFRNRRSLEEAYDALSENSALALIDLDDFKRVNDELSHAAGDRVLVEFSGLVADAAQSDDHLYRLGGDEFLILRRGATAPELAVWLHEVRDKQRAAGPQNARHLAFSAGVVNCGDSSLSEVLDRSDAAMYAAKDAGRDTIVVWD